MHTKVTYIHVASPEDADELRRLIAVHGEGVVAAGIGIPRHTLARLVARMAVRLGTLALMRDGIERLRKEAA